jgi:glycosyltransferase involved in cell wall biosynthesis
MSLPVLLAARNGDLSMLAAALRVAAAAGVRELWVSAPGPSHAAAIAARLAPAAASCVVRDIGIADGDDGVDAALVAGIRDVLTRHDRVAVVPEGVVPLPQFFAFAHAALARFGDDPRLGIVSGAGLQCNQRRGTSSAFAARLPVPGAFAVARPAWSRIDLAWDRTRGDALRTIIAERLRHDPDAVACWADGLRTALDARSTTLSWRLALGHLVEDLVTLLPEGDLLEWVDRGEPATTGAHWSIAADVQAQPLPEPFSWPDTLEPSAAADIWISRAVYALDLAWPAVPDAALRRARIDALLTRTIVKGVVDLVAAARERGARDPRESLSLATALLIANRPEAAIPLLAEASAAGNEGAARLADLLRDPSPQAERAARPPRVPSRTPLRVRGLCTGDLPGAGSAAVRMTTALQSVGIDARLLVVERTTDSPFVECLTEGASHPDWTAAVATAEDPLRRAGPHAPPTLVTTTRSAIDIATLIRAVDGADVIHMHWTDGMLDYDGARRALAGRAVAWTVHDMHPLTGGCHVTFGCRRFEVDCTACPQVSVGGQPIIASAYGDKRRLYEAIHPHFIATSGNAFRLLAESGLTKAYERSHVPLPIDTKTFCPMPQSVAREQLGLPAQDHVILFGAAGIGRAEKGLPLLLDALRRLAPALDRPATLAVFGHDGHLEVPRFPLRIRSLGVLPPNRLRQAFAAADAFVFPSHQEAFGMTVAESLACGTPVVGFPVGCIPDFVRDGRNGAIARHGDAADLARALGSVLAGIASGTPEVQAACRVPILAACAPDVVAQRLAAVYDQLLERTAAARGHSFPARSGAARP